MNKYYSILAVLCCFTLTAQAAAPTVTVTPVTASPTNASSIVFNVVFSESVTGFSNDLATDLNLVSTTGGTLAAAVGGSGASYTVTITGQTGTGKISLSVRAGAAQNGTTENNLVSNISEVDFDGVKPTVSSLVKKGSQNDPTNTTPVLFEITFSEAITGFTNADLTLGGTAGGTPAATISELAPMNGTKWEISVTGVSGNGTVTVSVPADAVSDAVGNTSTASGLASVEFDTNQPSISSLVKKGSQNDPTNSTPILFEITFDEAISGFTNSDLTLGGTAGGTRAATINQVAPMNGTKWEISVTGVSGNGTVTVSLPANAVTDLAGNTNTASSVASLTFDSTPPFVLSLLKKPSQADPTSSSPILYEITFSEAIIGFTNSDPTLAGTASGSLTASVSEIAPNDGTTWEISVSGMTGSGTVTVTLPAAGVTDLAGNNNAASGTASVTYDVSPPVITTYSPLDDATFVATDTDLILTFNKNVSFSATSASGNEDDIRIMQGGSTIQTLTRGDGAITIVGNIVTININDLNLNTIYHVRIGNKVFRDGSGNDFAGFDNNSTWNFTTSSGVSISAPAGGACVGTFSNLGPIVLTETTNNNIQGVANSTRTLVLQIDNGGFQFKPCTTCTGVTASFLGGGDIFPSTPILASTVTFSTATFSIPFGNGIVTNNADVITINGLQITSDGSQPNANVVKSASSTLTIQGVSNGSTILATLSTGTRPVMPSLNPPVQDVSFCLNENITAATISVTGTNIRWYSDAGLTTQVATGNSPTIKANLGVNETIAGSYSRYATQNTGGCESLPLTVPLVVNLNPIASAGTPSRIICSDEIITVGGSPTLQTASSGSSYTYAWSHTGPQLLPAIAANSNPQVDFPINFQSTNEVYTLSVEITDNLGCKGNASQVINVRPEIFVYLSKPSSTVFTPTTPAQELEATIPGGVFTGIGVVQSGPNSFKFDPAIANASNSDALPNDFAVSYSVTVNGCVKTTQISTFTISNSFFTNLLPTYCENEYPFSTPGVGGVTLQISPSADTEIVTSANDWNNTFSKFQQKLNSAAAWNLSLSYSPKQVVLYSGQLYAAKGFVPAGVVPSGNPAFWSTNILRATFKGQIRNSYEGYYNGNKIAPTVQKQGTTYTVNAKNYNEYLFYTNSNYNECVDCPYNEISAFLEFDNPSDIYYYFNDWIPNGYYFTNSYVTFNGEIYRCIKTSSYSFNESPSIFSGSWVNVSLTSFDAGYVYQRVSGGVVIESGFQTRGQFVVVNKVPVVGFSGLVGPVNADDFCQTNITYNLKGSKTDDVFVVNKGVFTVSLNGATPVTTLPGFSNTSSGNATLNPFNLVSGNAGALNEAVITYEFDTQTDGSTGQACVAKAERTITVQVPPSFTFASPTPNDGDKFCFEEPSALLRTTQNTNVVYSGFGVVNKGDGRDGTFKPDEAFGNAGGTTTSIVIPISSTFTSPFGCSNTITRNFEVLPKPTASFNPQSGNPNDLFYCYDEATIRFIGNTLVGGSTSKFSVKFKGQTNSDPDSLFVGNEFDFNPKLFYDKAVRRGQNALNDALFEIIYELVDANNCTSTTTRTYTVSPTLDVRISGLVQNENFCSNQTKTVILSPFPTDAAKRTLRFNNVIQPLTTDKFTIPIDPIIGGPVELLYEVIGGTNCISPKTLQATARPTPVAAFSIPPDALRCVGYDVNFSATIGTNAANAVYTWELQEQTVLSTTAIRSFPSSGTYNVNLIVNYPQVGGVVCSDTKRDIILIGDNPILNFSFANICQGETTQFEANFVNAPVNQYQWKFGTLGSTAFGNSAANIGLPSIGGTFKEPLFALSNGEHYVRVIGKTVNNCTDTIQKRVVILPKISVTNLGIYEMGDSDGQWETESLQVDSLITWQFGDPNGTKIGKEDNKESWITNLTGAYNPNEQSAVNSPCFNLSDVSLARPVISLDYWSDTREGLDGAVLQYSTNGGLSWSTLGSRNSGINWFNRNGISSNPPGPANISDAAVGWSFEQPSNENDWLTAKHTLDPIPVAQRANVRFRIRFASNADTKKSLDGDGRIVDGFAFRNVKIENRNRTLLVENFSNNNDADDYIDNRTNFLSLASSSNTNDLVPVQFNSSIGGEDPLNLLNPSDANARVAFYGITQSFQGFIDGESKGDFRNPTWASSNASLRSLVTSPLEIDIDTAMVEDGILKSNFAIDIKSTINNQKAYSIFAAIVEISRSDGNNFLFRKFIPNAAGIPLTKFVSGEAQQVTLENNLDITGLEVNSLNTVDNLALILFVQELSGSKEILQTKFYPIAPFDVDDLITGIESPVETGFSAFPNPANDRLTVRTKEAVKETTAIQVIDAFGRSIEVGSIQKGNTETTVNTKNLSDGVYTLTIANSKNTFRKKVVITH